MYAVYWQKPSSRSGDAITSKKYLCEITLKLKKQRKRGAGKQNKRFKRAKTTKGSQVGFLVTLSR